jgi:hypothetical protein
MKILAPAALCNQMTLTCRSWYAWSPLHSMVWQDIPGKGVTMGYNQFQRATNYQLLFMPYAPHPRSESESSPSPPLDTRHCGSFASR